VETNLEWYYRLQHEEQKEVEKRVPRLQAPTGECDRVVIIIIIIIILVGILPKTRPVLAFCACAQAC
jgi:hypothetical protein